MNVIRFIWQVLLSLLPVTFSADVLNWLFRCEHNRFHLKMPVTYGNDLSLSPLFAKLGNIVCTFSFRTGCQQKAINATDADGLRCVCRDMSDESAVRRPAAYSCFGPEISALMQNPDPPSLTISVIIFR